jgi:hypothetical protein
VHKTVTDIVLSRFQPVPRLSAKLLRLLGPVLYRKKTGQSIYEEQGHQVVEKEYCGTLKFSASGNEMTVMKLSVGRNLYDATGRFIRGICDRKSRYPIAFHTHFEDLIIYPSAEDIMSVITRPQSIEYIFTVFGFWEIRNVNIPDYFKNHYRTTFDDLNKILYLNEFHKRPVTYDNIVEFAYMVMKYVDGLQIRFIDWPLYAQVFPDQKHDVPYLTIDSRKIILKNAKT